MTFGDLLDQIKFDSDDSSSDYRIASRRWLNLTRSYIADEGPWRQAFKPTASFTTSALTTNGLYAIGAYDWISADLYDESNNQTIRHESFCTLQEIDPLKNVTGPPSWWGDGGTDASGNRLVYLWPIPDATYTIRVPAYALLTDLTENDDTLETDPYFGPLSPWSACMSQGLRYYHDLNNNEDAEQVLLQQRSFDAQIRRRKAKNHLSVSAPVMSKIWREGSVQSMGRFDPAHYGNR